ncbi:MAG TPA: hypothetical protein H9924_05510 [Candidatus Phocaeicola merdavium]|nr:hypothetical protein [Candidatus Phocaeicola merdavium]
MKARTDAHKLLHSKTDYFLNEYPQIANVGAYRIRPECTNLSTWMFSGVCDTPLQFIG